MFKFLTFMLAGDVSNDSKSKIGRVLMTFSNMIDDLIYPFLIAFSAAGLLYSIYLGVNYSKSEGDARVDARKRIINFIIGFVSIVVLLLLLKVFCNNAESLVAWIDSTFYSGK